MIGIKYNRLYIKYQVCIFQIPKLNNFFYVYNINFYAKYFDLDYYTIHNCLLYTKTYQSREKQ